MGEPEPARKDPTLSATTRRLGRYELLTQIGKGGMAEVHLAMQRGPGGFEKLVVIKLVHDHLASQQTFVDMLLEEGRLAGMIKHPNVVDVYDLGEAEGRYYVAMEYLDGEPLLAILRQGVDGERMDVLSTARVIADTAEGLEAAHRLKSLDGKSLGLVHHDVSLGNIVVLYNGLVKLVDFGVAKARTTKAGIIQGKFAYMAPEKLREGSDVDRRSDIWSLGVVAWEALTLNRLFKGDSDGETMRQVLELPIPPPSQANPNIPAEFDRVILRALERDPEKRYSTAKGFGLDLEDVLRKKGYAGKNDRIAGYMETTFAKQIAVRQRLVAELSAGRTSREAIEAFRDAARTERSGQTPVSVPIVVRGDDGSVPIAVSTPDPGRNRSSSSDLQRWLDERKSQPAWKRYLPFAAGGVVLLIMIIAIAKCGSSDKTGAADAAIAAPVDAAIAHVDTAVAVVDKPITDKPATDKPITDKPITDKPITDKPATDKPGKPITDKPKPDKPITDKPKPDKPRPVTDKPKPDKPRPAGAEALFRYGMEQLRRNDAKGALDTFNQATKANASYGPAWYGLGRAQEDLGYRRGPVKSSYQRYLSLDPKGPYAGDAHKRMGDL